MPERLDFIGSLGSLDYAGMRIGDRCEKNCVKRRGDNGFRKIVQKQII